MPETIKPTNFLKVSDLIESKAVISIKQIIDQINKSVLTAEDMAAMGDEIAAKIVNAAILLAEQPEFSFKQLADVLKIKAGYEPRWQEILLQTGFFTVVAGSEASFKYSSPLLQEFFLQLSKGKNNPDLNYRRKDYSVDPKKLWHIPGQNALIGPIDPDDLQTLYRMGMMERDPKYNETVEHDFSQDEAGLQAWGVDAGEFDKTRLDKTYGIYGSPTQSNQGEVGEIQGGVYLYKPSPEVLQIIKTNPTLLSAVERISGSKFHGNRVVEISAFKTVYGLGEHIAAGLRQVVTREYLATKTQAQKIKGLLIGTTQQGEYQTQDLQTNDRIFLGLIQPDSLESKRMAESVGQEYAGNVVDMLNGQRTEYEVWVVNRQKLQNRILRDALAAGQASTDDNFVPNTVGEI